MSLCGESPECVSPRRVTPGSPSASTFREIITSEARGHAIASKCQRCRTQPERKVSGSRGWWALVRLIASSLGCLAASESQSASEASRRFQPKVSSHVGALREKCFQRISAILWNCHNLTCLLWIQRRTTPDCSAEPQKMWID